MLAFMDSKKFGTSKEDYDQNFCAWAKYKSSSENYDENLLNLHLKISILISILIIFKANYRNLVVFRR